MCLYIGGGALSAFLPALQYQMIPDLYSAEGPESRQLFPSSSRSKHPLSSTVQGPDWEYFPGVSPDSDQYVVYIQCPDYKQVSTDFPVSPSTFGRTAMLATKKGSLTSGDLHQSFSSQISTDFYFG